MTTLLSRVEVDGKDTAFAHPTKPIGPVYSAAEATQAAAEHGWQMAADAKHMRSVLPLPRPVRMLGLEPIRWLLDEGAFVIAAGAAEFPWVEAACNFVRQTGRRAAIGSLEQIGDLLSGQAGTQICIAGEGELQTLP